MRPPRLSLTLGPLAAALLLLGAARSVHADERVVYYAPPTESPGFFQRVGYFFRGMFATQQSLSDRPEPPRPTAPRYNLDLPPPGSGYGYGSSYAHQRPASSSEQKVRPSTTPAPPRTRMAKQHPAPPIASTDSGVSKSSEKSRPEPTHKPKHASDEVITQSITSSTPTDSSESVKPSHEAKKSVPSGTRTSKSSRVKSPYPPYNELDVSGLPSGSLAMDPTTQKVFRVP